jgi:hypothetical protein
MERKITKNGKREMEKVEEVEREGEEERDKQVRGRREGKLQQFIESV